MVRGTGAERKDHYYISILVMDSNLDYVFPQWQVFAFLGTVDYILFTFTLCVPFMSQQRHRHR